MFVDGKSGNGDRSGTLGRRLVFLRGAIREWASLFACCIYDFLGAYANAVFHIEDCTIDGDSIEERGSQMRVTKV